MKEKAHLLMRTWAAIAFLFGAAVVAPARTIYVQANGTGDYPTIQAAIDAATDGDVVVLQPGIYSGPGNRDIDFLGKAITVRSVDPDDPDIVADTIIDSNGTESEPHRAFYFHRGEDPDSLLSGLTITNGYAVDGGGICCDKSSPVITNCTITGNQTIGDLFRWGCWDGGGAGVCCKNFSSPTISKCIITANVAHAIILASAELANGQGGGLYCSESSPTIKDCQITRNKGAHGGGVYCFQSRAIINKCKISANSATDDGGGISCHQSSPVISNSLISGNIGWAWYGGGGIYCYESSPFIINCTVAGNRHRGSKSGGLHSCANSNPTLVNCILWANLGWVDEPSQVVVEYHPRRKVPSSAAVRYSNIQGGLGQIQIDPNCTIDWGLGNINVEPMFVQPGNWDANDTPQYGYDDFWLEGDYHLKSQAGRWDPVTERWGTDDVTSPCIDAGDPMSLIGHEPFPNGGRINMGAYGGTAEASKSYFGESLCETIVAGDINGDCKVDFADFIIMAFHWLEGKNL